MARGIGMAAYRATISAAIGITIQEFSVRNAILVGKLPRPAVNSSGRFAFSPEDIEIGIRFFESKLGVVKEAVTQ